MRGKVISVFAGLGKTTVSKKICVMYVTYKVLHIDVIIQKYLKLIMKK